MQLEAVAVEEPVGVRFDWQTAPLEGLGLVQLVQRLGSMIERRRERRAQADAHSSIVPAGFADADVEPAAPEDAVQAMAAFFGSAPTVKTKPAAVERPAQALRPDFLRSLSLPGEVNGEDAISDLSLPRQRPAVSPSPAGNDTTEDEPDDGSNAGFSSLLGMNNPSVTPKGESVLEPGREAELPGPAVAHPRLEARAPAASRRFDPPENRPLGGDEGAAAPAAPPPPVPADTDAALRAALATLQRMSGTL